MDLRWTVVDPEQPFGAEGINGGFRGASDVRILKPATTLFLR